MFKPVRMHDYHVHTWGQAESSRPPLFLVHGWMDVGASYQFMVDAMDDEFFANRLIIAPDWRGFGHSTGPACDHYTFADYMGDLDALIEAFAPGQAVDLVGHSMGGNVSMMYAGARPERIRRLINLEGFGLPASEAAQAPGRYARWLDQIQALGRGEKPMRSYDSLAGVAARLMKTNPRLPQDKANWLASQWSEARVDENDQTRWHILGDAAHRVVSAQLFRVDETLALYAAIQAPVLVVVASDSHPGQWWKDRYSLDEFYQRLAHVPSVQRQHIEDAGHMLHHDQPQALARLVEDFLGA